MSISKTNLITICFVALILIISIEFSESKKLSTQKENSEWFAYSNCYSYKTQRLDAKADAAQDVFFLGRNKLTGKYVYLFTSVAKPSEVCKADTVGENGFKIHSVSSYNDKYFTNKATAFSGYFCWEYKICKDARNEGEVLAEGKVEVRDVTVNNENYTFCNYTCRAVYPSQWGRCTPQKQTDGKFHCTFVALKTDQVALADTTETFVTKPVVKA